MKEYKYWLYYDSNGELYAYTDDKKIKKDFEYDRDMRMFKSKKKNLTREEVNILAKNNSERKLVLEDLRGYSNGEIFTTKMAITGLEKLTIHNESASLLYYDIFPLAEVSPYIFKEDIVEALYILKYLHVHEAYEDCRHTESIPDSILTIEDEFKINTLNMFLNHYGKTMSKEG
jgi:hypothetical protein